MIRKVSVAILSWNGRQHLETCLAALAAQEDPGVDWEMLVLDNGSTDGTAEWFKAKNFGPRVRLIESPVNLGFCAGNNRLAEAADGDALALLNNDTRPEPGWLAALVDALASAPDDVAAVSGKIVDWEGERLDFGRGVMTFDGHAFQLDFRRPLGQARVPKAGEELLFACGGNLLVRRASFLAAGGFDESYFAYLEDVDLGWRLWSGGERVVFAPEAVVRHRSSATSDLLGLYNRGFLFERNAFLTAYKNYEPGLWERIMPGRDADPPLPHPDPAAGEQPGDGNPAHRPLRRLDREHGGRGEVRGGRGAFARGPGGDADLPRRPGGEVAGLWTARVRPPGLAQAARADPAGAGSFRTSRAAEAHRRAHDRAAPGDPLADGPSRRRRGAPGGGAGPAPTFRPGDLRALSRLPGPHLSRGPRALRESRFPGLAAGGSPGGARHPGRDHGDGTALTGEMLLHSCVKGGFPMSSARTLILALLLALMLAPSAPLQAASNPVQEFAERMETIEGQLLAGEWQRAWKGSSKLVDDLTPRLGTGKESSRFLARAVTQRALAAAGLGKEEEAVWYWHTAQNLDPDFRTVELDGYGKAGELLERNRLRKRGEADAAVLPVRAEGAIQPPVLKSGKSPRLPPALWKLAGKESLVVQCIVDADGRPRDPVIVSGSRLPSYSHSALLALRDWRFAPAQSAQGAVPVLWNVRIVPDVVFNRPGLIQQRGTVPLIEENRRRYGQPRVPHRPPG